MANQPDTSFWGKGKHDWMSGGYTPDERAVETLTNGKKEKKVAAVSEEPEKKYEFKLGIGTRGSGSPYNYRAASSSRQGSPWTPGTSSFMGEDPRASFLSNDDLVQYLFGSQGTNWG